MTTEMVTEETVETTVKAEPQQQAAAVTVESLQAELDRVQKALKETNKESASRRKRLEELEAADKQRKDAELSDLEKAKNELTATQTQLQALRRAQLARSVADEVGLPAVLADRLVGVDREAMLEDAKKVLESLPKQDKKAPPQGSATNPGNATTQETDAQKRKRLGLA